MGSVAEGRLGSFDVTPRTIYLQGVVAGKGFDSRRDGQKSIRIANYSQEPLGLALTSEVWDTRFDLSEGYTPIPDPSWVVLNSSHVKVAAESIAQAGFVVRVPDAPERRGKKYAALIRTGLDTGFWLDAPVRVFIETKP
jgi:hypothetical protein